MAFSTNAMAAARCALRRAAIWQPRHLGATAAPLHGLSKEYYDHTRSTTGEAQALMLAAATAASAAIVANTVGGSPTCLEETPPYMPPPRFSKSFSSLSDAMPGDKAGLLAWAVKHLEVDTAKSILEAWPHGAELIDNEDNTLFHVASLESSRYSARPEDAQGMLDLLLSNGWAVVDQKNRNGERAEIVADRLDPQGPWRQMLRGRSRAFQEPLRSEKPLPIIGDVTPAPWRWQYPVQDEQRRCWAGVSLKAFPSEKCKEWMDAALTKSPWADLPGVPRKVAWFVSKECMDCPYRYSGLEYPPTEFPPFMQEIREEICKLCGIPAVDFPNSCNVNVYDDGEQEVGWHSDDEVMFQGLSGDTRILSFSLGSARDFSWRLQGTTDTLGSVPLGDGDVMTMEGLFQKHYKHSVPKSDTPCGKRVNFTFRWIKVKAHAVDACTKGVK